MIGGGDGVAFLGDGIGCAGSGSVGLLLMDEVEEGVGEVALLRTLVLDTLPPPNKSSSSSSNCLLDRKVEVERNDVVLTLLLLLLLLLPSFDTSISPNMLLAVVLLVRRGDTGVLLLTSKGEVGLELRDKGSAVTVVLVRVL